MKSNFVAQKEMIDPRVVVGRPRPATVRLPGVASKWVTKKARPGRVSVVAAPGARSALALNPSQGGSTAMRGVGSAKAEPKRSKKAVAKRVTTEVVRSRIPGKTPASKSPAPRVVGVRNVETPVGESSVAAVAEVLPPTAVPAPGVAAAKTTVSEAPSRQPYDENTALRLYLKDAVEVELLTPEQEVALAHRIRAGDDAAREHMIRANLRLVVKIAREYEDFGLPLLDLINEGNIGLMHAVERFDPSKGAKLSTYAAWWIKQSIRRALSNQSKAIRLPIHVVQELARMKKAESRLEAELGRPPSEGELAAELDGTLEDIVRWRQAAAIGATSLDAPLGNDPDSNRVADVVADENSRMPWSDVAAETDAALVRELVNTLNAREQLILRRRFALDGGEPETLETIGASFGLTRERIRQLEAAALKKLKDRLRKREAMQLAA